MNFSLAKRKTITGSRKDNLLLHAIDNQCYVATFNPHGTVVDANERFVQKFGYGDLALLRGTHLSKLFDGTFGESNHYPMFWRELLNGVQKSGKHQHIDADGNVFGLQSTFLPATDASGQVESVMLLATDGHEGESSGKTKEAITKTVDRSFAYIQFSPTGEILEANQNFIDFMGYSSLEEIQGEHHSMFVDKNTAESADYQAFWNALGSGETISGDFQRITRDRRNVWIRASYTPILDAKGQVQSVVKIAHDITQDRAQSQQLEAYKTAIDTSFAYIQFEPDGTIIGANENFVRTMEYGSIEEIAGQRHHIFVHEEEAASADYADFWRELGEGQVKRGQFRRLTKNRKEVWLLAAYSPLRNAKGEVEYVIKIAADISDARLVGDQVKSSLKEEVSKNLNDINQAISEMASGAQRQVKETDQSSRKIESTMQLAKEVEGLAQSVQQVTKANYDSSEKGREIVGVMVENMADINAFADNTQSSMDELNTGTSEISRMLAIMKDIAAQTNLLALNAAIEAAQAGDAGRGFAVVADEIRKLAESAKSSVKDIETLVASIESGSQQVVDFMKQMLEKVDDGSKATGEVSDIFMEMLKKTEKASDLSSQIVQEATRQREDMKEVVEGIESVVVVAEQSAAGSQEVQSAAQKLATHIESF